MDSPVVERTGEGVIQKGCTGEFDYWDCSIFWPYRFVYKNSQKCILKKVKKSKF